MKLKNLIKEIDFMGSRKQMLIFSFVLSLLSCILLFTKGLNLGIDFAGGLVAEFKINQQIDNNKLKKIFLSKGFSEVNIEKNTSKNGEIITLKILPNSNQEDDIVDNISKILKGKFHNVEIEQIDYIGPKVGDEFVESSLLAIFWALLAMMCYTWMRFNLRFGIGVMITLLHDVLITFGFFSITQYQFDLTSIAVVLTIVGYSINDSIVIYDRIRENLKIEKMDLKNNLAVRLINRSINETLSRTIMTSFTTLIVCLALFFLGGETIEGFSAALSFGIIFGTYSSICISAPILTFWNKK